MGFEPTTIGLENRDSTAELHSQKRFLKRCRETFE
ncbi:MAG: hypothetical protein RL411_948 [Bacteroidota bacterium]